eukprot:CAMPEP_0170198740 /NCGR_PEP_ID=MMETSP0040_2-20121228/68952_1 /TAXON_ID=641309 /ORGANISM="Lotharella oceanica, Strain CCMP622" /LENGTH=82 /DNA_ID=CAMNT_0010448787 /DNA_START=669 /DNA_END=917 /DNA_ORIENTATION=+
MRSNRLKQAASNSGGTAHNSLAPIRAPTVTLEFAIFPPANNLVEAFAPHPVSAGARCFIHDGTAIAGTDIATLSPIETPMSG